MKSDSHLTAKISSLPFLIVGFLAGVVLAMLAHYSVSYTLAYAWVSLYSLMSLLAYPPARSFTRLALITVISSFLASIPFVWPNSEYATSHLGMLLIFTVYAINAFHIAYQEHGFRLPYESLFFAVWNTFIKILIACFFTGLCWLILKIWSALFNLIGIGFFDTLFLKHWFIIWSLPFFGSIGLWVATITEKVVRNLRIVILAICKFLLPVLAIIGILFLISWLIVVVLLQHTLTLNPALFLTFSFLTIIFTNGVYQDGQQEKPYSDFFLWIVNFFLILSPLFAFLAIYALVANMSPSTPSIFKDGLNALSFIALINAVLVLLYTLCYAVIVIKREKPWLKRLGKANIILAIIVIATTLLLNNKWFQKASFNPGNIRPSSQQIKQHQINQTQRHYRRLNKRFNASPFVWKKQTADGVILGRNNGNTLILCRSKIKDKYYVGTISAKKCQIARDNKVILTSNFTTFSGPSNQLIWLQFINYSNKTARRFPLPISFDGQYLYFVCRTIYNNRIYIGIYSYKDLQCHIISNKKLIKQPAFQYLYISPLK